MPKAGTSSAHSPRRRISVLLPLPLPGPYDYAVPEEASLAPGDFVVVPLGGREVAGVVWDGDPEEESVPDAKLKAVAAQLPVPPLTALHRRFIAWVASYNCAPAGSVLRMAMSVPSALLPPAPKLAYRAAGPLPERLTSARRRVLKVLGEGLPRTPAELRELTGVSSSVLAGLRDAGAIEECLVTAEPRWPQPDPERPGPTLTPEQAEAAEALRAAVAADRYQALLLDGVTGSGKTEVYLEAVAACLARGRQVLVLVPEIALTADWLRRFEERFGAAPVAWHSELRASERRRHWRAVAEGQARVVVGARSALFLPYPELGLIVVDEEHDGAFKQEDGVMYNARDMAVVRASLGAFPVVLVSATPSLESMANAESGRYRRLCLPSRAGGASLPVLSAIDMRRQPPPRGQWLSPVLTDAVRRALDAGEQALLFLNRRGYAPLTLCRACGHRMECPNCSAWLVEHRFAERLQCHHCGFLTAVPERCPGCDAAGRFAACGPGVERLLEEVAVAFPEARSMMVASDTVRGPRAAAEVMRTIADHEVDVVVGTQIIAKGHHFPMLTCVGLVDADLGLAGGDLRAAERTYQLISQVAGRAGRAARPGHVFLQTYAPEHPVMQALIAGDRDGFLEREAEGRRRHGMPPYGRLVALIVSGADEAQVMGVAQVLARAAPRYDDCQVLGPAPAPFYLLRGRFRQRLLLKTPRGANASEIARRWLAAAPPPPGAVRVQVDVDPYSFF